MKKARVLILLGIAALLLLAAPLLARLWERRYAFHPFHPVSALAPPAQLSTFQQAVIRDLDRQVRANIRYRDGYYQGGDPPPDVGVCTDVVIRSFRSAGVDLQQEVADDIRAHPGDYHVARPDPNIDHRRCRVLVRYFRRHALSLPVSGPQADWQPGDIVFMDTHRNGQADHVAVIANGRDSEGDPTFVHHWPSLPVAETDGLRRFPLLYHFRWKPAR